MWDNTQEWEEMQLGIDYNNKINLYATTELNWNMYNDKQWVGVKTNGLSKWQFNICKSSINYFIAFICSQKVKMQYSAENIPDEPTDPHDLDVRDFTTKLSAMADMKWEKDKMDSKLRQLMLDGAVSKDFCAYVYWNANKETGQDEKGDFCTEVVDGINVLFGNPNNREVEAQPYILILGREMVSKLKKEAKKNGVAEDLINTIQSDSDTQYQVGANGKIELDGKNDAGKCNYIIKFWKDDNGRVYWNKSTKYCPIRKDVDLGIKRYPIAFGNWETIKNSYHGNSAIEGIIDNQISINQLFAMVSYWMKMAAFGKVAYDKTRIQGKWSNTVGEAIGVEGPVTDIVKQLEAGNFNAAILNIIELAIKYTKDFIGANDSLMGQVNPEQASGTAIISSAKQAAMPLGNIAANRDQFIEDLGLIWGEFFLKKYNNRKVSYRENEKIVTSDYSNKGMEDILLQCKVDVGPSNYYSELMGIQSLDNLFKMGKLTDVQYFERMAKMNVIPDCKGLVEDARKMMAMQQQMAQQQQIQQQQASEQQSAMQQQSQEQAMQEQQAQDQAKQQQFEKMAKFMESLPKETQERLKALPPDVMEQEVMKMMKQSVGQSMK